MTIINLTTILILSNIISQSICQVEQNVEFSSLLDINVRLQEAFCNLQNHGTDSMVFEAMKVIEFLAELVLKNFPESSHSADTFIRLLSEGLQSGFAQANDDDLVQIRIDDVSLDDVAQILRDRKDSMVEDLVRIITSQDSFLKQVVISLENGFVQNYYSDTYEDTFAHCLE
eukprot:TRINITY_DN29459_c0_g5_i1.p1 TRINITY_DN29459_c0_g5~~TRINITY_DN29459_c0_g5_i1.p1  ORF type:complete len:194 (+),score=11.18 TRINITY_DN29459_c0_g5_i1:68-583(+)